MKRNTPDFDRKNPPPPAPLALRRRLDESGASIEAVRSIEAVASIVSGLSGDASLDQLVRQAAAEAPPTMEEILNSGVVLLDEEEPPRFRKIAASARVDALWQQLDAVPTRLHDLSSAFGSLNNLMLQQSGGGSLSASHELMTRCQTQLVQEAARTLSYSAALLVPQVRQSLQFSTQHVGTLALASALFDDQELWKLLPDQENSRRARRNEPKRRGPLFVVEYVDVDVRSIAPAGVFRGIRIKMGAPDSADRAASYGKLAFRLRRKKGEGPKLFFTFSTPAVANDLPITLVIYHDQERMEKDNRQATKPLRPIEGIVETAPGRREWVAFYDLLWLYAAASNDGSLFKYRPEYVASTFHSLTGLPDQRGTFNATLDVLTQRVRKPDQTTPKWLPYIARRRNYNVKSSIRGSEAVPARVLAGPSYVEPPPPAPQPKSGLDMDSVQLVERYLQLYGDKPIPDDLIRKLMPPV